MLLEEPAMFRDHPSRRLELWRHRVGAADPLAESGNAEQVVANRAAGLTEVVAEARFDILGRVRGKQRPRADGQLVLTPQLQRKLLILKVARIDHAGESQAIGMRV